MRSIRGNVRALVVVSAVLTILVVLAPAGAAPGDLDPSFGVGGTVETQISSQAAVQALAIQADGKIVAGGYAYPPAGTVALARYEPNGKLDTAFGSGGIATGVLGNVKALALQPDGKILLVGNSSDSNTRRSFFSIARYRQDGSPDATFGSDGLVRGPDGGANAVALQTDGRIVVAGTEPENYAFKLVRLNVDGTLDSSFGSNGSVRALLGYAASASAVIVQPDGRILAAGASVPGNPPPPPPPPPAPPPPPPPGPPPLPWDLTLLRYGPDGSLDRSFGSSGVVTTRLGPGSQVNAPAASVALQPDGNIVAAAENDRRFALARYGTDGALDPTFGANGIVKTELQQNSGFPSELALQTDGLIVVAGSDGLARYLSNGAPDAAFGINGVARANVSTSAFVLQQDGRIVTGGSLHNHFALSRYAGKSPTTIGAAPAVVAYGRTALVRGTLERKQSGVVVKVTQRGCYGFRTRVIATTTTVAGGSWHARVSPRSRTSVTAMVDGEASLPLIVQVRPKLMLKRLSPTHVRARGVAGRSLADQTVILQRFARGRWANGRRVTLRRSARRGSTVISEATFRARAGQRLRLFLRPNDFTCYASAASRAIRR